MPHRRTRDTEPMDKILLWAVQSQGQWRSVSSELSQNRHREWPPHLSQRSGGCSTIIDEREVCWSQQHPIRTGLSKWRGCNHHSRDNLQQYLADRGMSSPVDPVLSLHTSQERQTAAVPELPNYPCKVMLKFILNKLKPQAEKIFAEEWAGFSAGKSTTEQIFNLLYLHFSLILYFWSHVNWVTTIRPLFCISCCNETVIIARYSLPQL